MSSNTTHGIPHPSGVLIPVSDFLQHVHEPVSFRHPTGLIRPHCLAEIAKLLRRFPTGGALRVLPGWTLEVHVGADAVPDFTRALAVLQKSLCATAELDASASVPELTIHFPKGILSMRQLYALAAVAHVENAAALRLGASLDTAHLLGVAPERHASVALELAEYGFIA